MHLYSIKLCNVISLLLFAIASSAQNVGIGTSTPLQKLHVEGNTFIKDSISIGIDSAKAKLDVKGTVLFRGGNNNSPTSPTAAIEFFTGRLATGAKPAGLLQSDMAFNFGGPGGGYRHFIVSRHDNLPKSPGNAFDFYINNAANATGSLTPGTGNLRMLSITANGIKIDSNYSLEFGQGIAGKENNAGKIGYQIFTPDALDITGAGTTETNRKIKFWAKGGTEMNGPLNVDSSITVAGSATIAGDANMTGNAYVTNNLNVNGTVNMGYTYLYKDYSITQNQIRVLSITCPGNTQLTGGGGGSNATIAFESPADILNIHYNGPDPDNPLKTWKISVRNIGTVNRTLRIYCLCARIN